MHDKEPYPAAFARARYGFADDELFPFSHLVIRFDHRCNADDFFIAQLAAGATLRLHQIQPFTFQLVTLRIGQAVGDQYLLAFGLI